MVDALVMVQVVLVVDVHDWLSDILMILVMRSMLSYLIYLGDYWYRLLVYLVYVGTYYWHRSITCYW
jgi:hypothetical protein